MIGSEFLRLNAVQSTKSDISLGSSWLHSLSTVAARAASAITLPDKACMAWGVALASIAALGGFSCSRPACDIFIAGTSQTFPTFFLILSLLSWQPLAPEVRLCSIGLLTNCPLVFLYPWFVQKSGLALGTINVSYMACWPCLGVYRELLLPGYVEPLVRLTKT